MSKSNIGIWQTAANGDSYYRNLVLEFNQHSEIMPSTNMPMFRKWMKETFRITEWKEQKFYFDDARDLVMFLLRWGA